MGFSLGNLFTTLGGALGMALSPLTGGVTGAFGGPMLAQGLGGMLGSDPEAQKPGVKPWMPKQPQVVQPNNEYTEAIRRLAEQ